MATDQQLDIRVHGAQQTQSPVHGGILPPHGGKGGAGVGPVHGLNGNAGLSGGGSGTTWGTQADWGLTNNNLTATRNGTSTFWGTLHASAAKASGTAIFTITAIGAAGVNRVGFDLGTEANGLGQDATGISIGYGSDGSIIFAGGTVATVATWTTGDAIKIIKTGVSFAFYKNNVLQTTIDSSSATYGKGTVLQGAAYPSIQSGNATGLSATADFSAF